MMKMAEIELESAVGQKSHSLGLNLTHKPFIRQELEAFCLFQFFILFYLDKGPKDLETFCFAQTQSEI